MWGLWMRATPPPSAGYAKNCKIREVALEWRDVKRGDAERLRASWWTWRMNLRVENRSPYISIPKAPILCIIAMNCLFLLLLTSSMYLISRFILHSAVLRFCTVVFTVISNTGADYLDLEGTSWQVKNAMV
jgi:hypothetical protein